MAASGFSAPAATDDSAHWAACIADAEVGAMALDIHTAASLGDEAVVLDALRRDAGQAVARNDLGWSPLMFAVWQGHEAVVLALLDASRRCGRGHDVTADPAVGRLPRSGRSLLMVAARFGYVRIASVLCQARALEMRDFRGQTALFHAVRGGNEELIRMLVSQGANVNACDLQGQTVLRLAQRCRPQATCLFLRNAGAKLEAKSAVPPPRVAAPPIGENQHVPFHLTLASVLEGLSLQKYLALFQLHCIDLEAFLSMSEDDLRQVGVSLLGPRRKMTLEIERLRALFGIGI
ncbi:hypothetical protein ONE63_008289 [Megalurothrips usitatus]|uniref:SAM domain-containing protein n=1 Tax=Megalurothrips usitatus TaxID=439358 RepID=A0AAV7XKN2_9NEOP|nr:hypothetical protein ONE63_008289 [Megalurothrips usitatus]